MSRDEGKLTKKEFSPALKTEYNNLIKNVTLNNLVAKPTSNDGALYSATVTIPTGIANYFDTMEFTLIPDVNCLASPKLNINTWGAIPIKIDNRIPNAGELKAFVPLKLVYYSGSFIVLGKGGGGNATSSDIRLNKTAYTDNGPVVGTMPEKGSPTILMKSNSINLEPGYYSGGIVKPYIDTISLPVPYAYSNFNDVSATLGNSTFIKTFYTNNTIYVLASNDHSGLFASGFFDIYIYNIETNTFNKIVSNSEFGVPSSFYDINNFYYYNNTFYMTFCNGGAGIYITKYDNITNKWISIFNGSTIPFVRSGDNFGTLYCNGITNGIMHCFIVMDNGTTEITTCNLLNNNVQTRSMTLVYSKLSSPDLNVGKYSVIVYTDLDTHKRAIELFDPETFSFEEIFSYSNIEVVGSCGDNLYLIKDGYSIVYNINSKTITNNKIMPHMYKVPFVSNEIGSMYREYQEGSIIIDNIMYIISPKIVQILKIY